MEQVFHMKEDGNRYIMKKHTKIYMDYFNYGIDDFIPCEVCGQRAVDIHHIDPKGIGGSKTKDHIENLIAVCRLDHIRAHSLKLSKETLIYIHKIKIKTKEMKV